MLLPAERLDALLRERFPAAGGLLELDYVGSRFDEAARSYRAVLRVLSWGVVPGTDDRTLNDVKEQEVIILPAVDEADEPRVAALLEGWVAALSTAFQACSGTEWLLPSDLTFPDVIDMARPQTSADFTAVFLKRSRLGKLAAGASQSR